MVIVNVEPEGQGGESYQPAARGCGTTTTILKCTKSTSPEAKVESDLQHQDMQNKILKENDIHATALPPFFKAKKKKQSRSKKKRLEDLLSYHQHLVVEKGLPPSRLMLLKTETVSSPSSINQMKIVYFSNVTIVSILPFQCMICVPT